MKHVSYSISLRILKNIVLIKSLQFHWCQIIHLITGCVSRGYNQYYFNKKFYANCHRIRLNCEINEFHIIKYLIKLRSLCHKFVDTKWNLLLSLLSLSKWVYKSQTQDMKIWKQQLHFQFIILCRLQCRIEGFLQWRFMKVILSLKVLE